MGLTVSNVHLDSSPLSDEVSDFCSPPCANSFMALKGPSQPPPFSMPSKLLRLHGEVKSECFTIRCVYESTFNYL